MKIALFAMLVITAMSTGISRAQEVECGMQRDIGAQALDEATWKQLNAIYQDVAAERYREAQDDLLKLLGQAGRDTYLRAIINQALAQVQWSLKNYAESLGYFEKALELDSLPDQAHFALMYQVSQLYFRQERYDEALERLQLWFCMSPGERITPGAYVLLASIYAEKEDYNGVLAAISTAISMDSDPREQWFQLRLAANYELEQYPGAAETLEIMIAKWPDRKTYWIQLSQIYFRLMQDQNSLAVLALAYRQGLLDKPADLMYLSGLYSYMDVPYKAAAVLEKGIRDGIVESDRRHWTMVAESWYAADELERSLQAFEAAGRAARNGESDLRRGFILVDLERWQEALESLDLALEKGGLDERKMGEAYLLRGMVEFYLGNLENANADWENAGRFDGSREPAGQWISFLQDERRRLADWPVQTGSTDMQGKQ